MSFRQQNVPEHLKKYLSDYSSEDVTYNNKTGSKKKKKKVLTSTNNSLNQNIIIKDIDDSTLIHENNKSSIKKPSMNDNIDQEEEEEDKDQPAIANLDQFNLNKTELDSLLNNKAQKTQWIPVNYKNENDLSPPRDRNRQRDLSPPRNRNRNRNRDLSPQRENKQRDLSPPRNRNRNDNDLSPPRDRNRNRDLSPPRKRDREEDLSPPRDRNRKSEVEDLSPPRDRNIEENKINSSNLPIEANKRLKMSHGGDAGLHTGAAIKEQALKRSKEIKESFQKADEKLLGKNANVVYRDKHGRRIEQEELERQKEEKENEKKFEWGDSGGMVQKQQKDELIKQIQEERTKSFSRYENDKDLNETLKNKDIWGDPMAFKKSKKEITSTTTSDISNNDNETSNNKPKYKGRFPPNRYGIQPGYRWDGVDRSNGFEKALFTKQSQLEDRKQQAYFWSIEDM